MARGWESKSVEEQQAEARQPASSSAPPSAPQSDADRRRAQQRETLRLAGARIQQQLVAAKDERYAAQLRAALEAIERKLPAK
jgi:hypothetical protein